MTIQLCKPEDCTGCQSCIQTCKHNAIQVQNDKHGFLHPIIDASKCIECGLCIKSCPILTPPSCKNNIQPETWAAWHPNKETRLDSSSGGAFSAIAEWVLDNNGVVFGASLSKDLEVKHVAINNKQQLHLIRKSKYVQSNINQTYIEAAKLLRQDKKVLFSGTPCQIAGLYAFLRNKRPDNLYTIDFICHGVPSPMIFTEYIKSMEQKYKHKISNVNFRDKRLGVETNLLMVFTLNNNEQKVEAFKYNSFYRGFINNLILRNSCYQCKYTTMPRIADITLADYRNIGNKYTFMHEKDRPLGFTGLLINNAHGDELLKLTNICYEKRDFDELASAQPHLKAPVKKPSNIEEVYEMLYNKGYDKTAEHFFPMSLKKRIEIYLRHILGVKLFYKMGIITRILTGKRKILKKNFSL